MSYSLLMDGISSQKLCQSENTDVHPRDKRSCQNRSLGGSVGRAQKGFLCASVYISVEEWKDESTANGTHQRVN